jgi:hypothetical protein
MLQLKKSWRQSKICLPFLCDFHERCISECPWRVRASYPEGDTGPGPVYLLLVRGWEMAFRLGFPERLPGNPDMQDTTVI